MKVIFVADVPSVAKVGQTKEVANGYARNYLFPRKLAVLANSTAAAAVDAHLKKLVKQHAILEAEMAELAKKINGTEITLRAKVGENDKLYGSITAADIAEALSKAAGVLIDKKNVAIAEPIKLAGVCDVTIKFMHDITAVIKTCVVDENATEEMIAQAKTKKAEAKKEKAEAPAEPKKAKAVKAGETAEKAEAAAEPKKEKSEKKEKKPKAEKPAKEEPVAEVKAAVEEKAVAEKPAKAEKAPAEKKAKAAKEEKVEEKPARAEKAPAEKKAKAEKAVKEEKPAAAAEEKKEKKPKAKAKKEDAD